MTVAEYNRQLEQFKNKLNVTLFKKVAAYAGATLRGQIENRVEQTQTDANGMPFSTYSTKPMLSSGNTAKSKRVWQKMASSKEKRKGLSWVTLQKGGKNIHLFEIPGGYAELRRLEGFSNVNKSFEFTGAMWDQFNVIDQQLYNDGFMVRMGGATEYSQELINKHSEDEGIAIIAPSKGEQEDLNRWVDEWIIQEIKKAKL